MRQYSCIMAKNFVQRQYPTQSPLDERSLSQFLTYRIARLHFELNAQAIAVLDDVSGLGLSQWRVLAMIASNSATTSVEIVNKMKIDPAIVSRTIRKLEDENLLNTERSSDDRRVVKVSTTQDGQALYEKTVPHMRRRQQILLDSLTSDQQAQIFEIMDRLETAAEIRNF